MSRFGFVDRFEGDVAVIEVDGKIEQRKRSSLPRGVKEGDVIDLVKGVVDPVETKKRKAAVAAARAKIVKGGGSFDL